MHEANVTSEPPSLRVFGSSPKSFKINPKTPTTPLVLVQMYHIPRFEARNEKAVLMAESYMISKKDAMRDATIKSQCYHVKTPSILPKKTVLLIS